MNDKDDVKTKHQAVVTPVRPGGYCMRCGHEVDSFSGLRQCPACQTQAAPCAWKDERQVTINLAEMRVLCNWAFSWAERISSPQNDYASGVARISDKLSKQVGEPASFLQQARGGR